MDQLKSRRQINKDWRVMLRVSEKLSPFMAERLYYILGEGGYKNTAVGKSNQTNGLLRTLTETGGVVFPYTPSINYSQTVDYQEVNLNHTNLQIKSYSNTPPPNITLTGKFTANNTEEARYLAAVIHFFRTVVKSDFGLKSYKLAQKDTNERDLSRGVPGSPPPILYLSGFGDLMNNETPVLIGSYSFDLPDDKDYIEVTLDGNNMGNIAQGGKTFDTISTWVPTEMSINLNLLVQMPIERYQREFNLHKFKTGQMLRSNFDKYSSSSDEVGAYSNWRSAGGSGYTW